jgi:hypothetical protein
MNARTTCRAALVLTGLLVPTAACAQGEDSEARQLAGSDEWRTDFGRHSVPLSEIVSGGPQKDGIPAIDHPRFESAAQAGEWLDDRHPVMIVEAGDAAKAYPLGILIWHEIVNDEVGGRPITVTYCPLCNTALAFDRRLGDRVLDFGTTGKLRQSDLVMYDRQTESWWQQAVGEAIVGELTGQRLEPVPANTYGWETARRLYPDVRVLSRDTGYPEYETSGRYGQNPYAGYDSRSGPYPRFFAGDIEEDLPAMERVAALDVGSGWAVGFGTLADRGPVNARFEEIDLVVLWEPGAASAVDRGTVSSGRDVGQSAVFDRRLDGRTLTFERRDGVFRDRETGSTWNLAGHAVHGPLAGRRLRALAHGNHFWFAWVAFRPDTELWTK